MREHAKSSNAARASSAERTSSAGTIYKHLEREILSGRLLPGMSLNEVALAEQFGVSKTPLREALLQLAAVNLIEFRPRQGAFVAEIPVSRISQMFEVMIGLEAHCASLSTERMTMVERKALARAAKECDSWADKGTEAGVDRFFDADNAFHQIIFEGSHNAYLQEVASNLHDRLTPYRRYRLQSPSRVKVSAEEHHRILDAVLSGDAERAAAETHTHGTIESALLCDIVSSLTHSKVEGLTREKLITAGEKALPRKASHR